MSTNATSPASGKMARRQYEPYLNASWGVKNYWFPALFSHELAEDEVKGVTIAGVPILLRRVDGRVHALRDQCLHRGVTMSVRPKCFSKDTLTCWYHGFTYDLETGKLKTIVGAPDDPMIGNARIQVFPAQEKAGIIFVFVGDVFELMMDRLGPVDAVYDRAALVALPETMRKAYAAHLTRLTGAAPQLLISFDYDQTMADGPPFSVPRSEIGKLYGEAYEIERLESIAITGNLARRCTGSEEVWLLSRR